MQKLVLKIESGYGVLSRASAPSKRSVWSSRVREVDVDLLRLRQPLQKDMQHAERPACVRHAAAAYSFRIEDRARAFAVMNVAPCGDQTHDHTLTKRMLYQLS
jgi:hypothetical protein